MLSRGALHQPYLEAEYGTLFHGVRMALVALERLFLANWDSLFTSIEHWKNLIQPLHTWLSGSPWIQWSATCLKGGCLIFDKGFMGQKSKSLLSHA